ncbi:hypothetical protein J6590_070561 [Homalodisca vitripennis]|nr:hypothetical protein J6590_070561 [Homalodisca vitripennis]
MQVRNDALLVIMIHKSVVQQDTLEKKENQPNLLNRSFTPYLTESFELYSIISASVEFVVTKLFYNEKETNSLPLPKGSLMNVECFVIL